MFKRTITSINFFIFSGLLISCITPLQAQTDQKSGLREYAMAGAQKVGRSGSAVVGGVRYSAGWVVNQLESGAKSFPIWGRRRIANSLQRFATPTAEEKEVIAKWVRGKSLTVEEKAVWRAFRNRALLNPKAIAAVVITILAMSAIIAGSFLYKKREEQRQQELEQAAQRQREEQRRQREEAARKRRLEEQQRKEQLIGLIAGTSGARREKLRRVAELEQAAQRQREERKATAMEAQRAESVESPPRRKVVAGKAIVPKEEIWLQELAEVSHQRKEAQRQREQEWQQLEQKSKQEEMQQQIQREIEKAMLETEGLPVAPQPPQAPTLKAPAAPPAFTARSLEEGRRRLRPAPEKLQQMKAAEQGPASPQEVAKALAGTVASPALPRATPKKEQKEKREGTLEDLKNFYQAALQVEIEEESGRQPKVPDEGPLAAITGRRAQVGGSSMAQSTERDPKEKAREAAQKRFYEEFGEYPPIEWIYKLP